MRAEGRDESDLGRIQVLGFVDGEEGEVLDPCGGGAGGEGLRAEGDGDGVRRIYSRQGIIAGRRMTAATPRDWASNAPLSTPG